MDKKRFIDKEVRKSYWQDGSNCAITALKTLGKIFHVRLNPQTVNSAIGLNGAGRYGAQCGLVEGTLMFIGIIGKRNGLDAERIARLCHDFAKKFERKFGSLSCAKLRPRARAQKIPTHPCEELTVRAISFSKKFIANNLEKSI